MAGIYRLQTDFPNVIIHFHIHLFGSTVAQTPSEKRIQGQNYERGHQPRKAIRRTKDRLKMQSPFRKDDTEKIAATCPRQRLQISRKSQ